MTDEKGVQPIIPEETGIQALGSEKKNVGRLESDFKALEAILAELDSQKIDFERSLVLYEQGLMLVKESAEILAQAEQKLQKLTTQGEWVEIKADK